MKEIITWKRVQIGTHQFIDPNTQDTFNQVTEGATFTETPYQLADGRFISMVEIPDGTTQERIDSLIQAYSAFEFTFITEEEANLLLKELGEDENGIQYVRYDNFVDTDNRPIINLF